ncbi:Hypothetical predicted protein [Mytilus galloprovincialis]|uniref:BTB domain-containing protein n=1 Tax=Mytilus galloprovincialis TaxID=29158 RepID=A0A8B6CD84_MYTGA|nr:Hypothetical predicted protein [Mytilus galloprovincialis]
MEKEREDDNFVFFREISQNKDSLSKDEWSKDAEEDLTEYEELIASPFKESNIAFVFGKRKLHLQKEHLIAVSPVFEAMFSSKFLEGSLTEIPLPDKKISHFVHFVHFLRYLSPGFLDELTEDTVHHMLPLAEEYQTDDLKKRIDDYLTKSVLSHSDSITSVKIILNILEAEQYKLNGYLNACIGVASQKQVNMLTKNPRFEEISQKVQLKIGLKRMEDIDKIYNNGKKVGSFYSKINFINMIYART